MTRVCRECGLPIANHGLVALRHCARLWREKLEAARLELQRQTERAQLEQMLATVKPWP